MRAHIRPAAPGVASVGVQETLVAEVRSLVLNDLLSVDTAVRVVGFSHALSRAHQEQLLALYRERL